MMRSMRVGRIARIPVLVHPLFVLFVGSFLAWRAFRGGPRAGLDALATVVLLLATVLVHEIAHALVARRLGVRVLDVTLWPLGGMTRLGSGAKHPRIEVAVAAAGPAANLVLAALLLPLRPVGPLLETLFAVNAIVGLFNLVPAFPMDGGRVLRALLCSRRPFAEATESAVGVGRTIAAVAIAVGLVYPPLLLALAVTAAFVWWSGNQELAAARARAGLPPRGLFGLSTWWREFVGGERGERPDEPPSPRPAGDDLVRELESFKGPMHEFFDKKAED